MKKVLGQLNVKLVNNILREGMEIIFNQIILRRDLCKGR